MMRFYPPWPRFLALLLLGGACAAQAQQARTDGNSREASTTVLGSSSLDELLKALPTATPANRFSILLNLSRRTRRADLDRSLGYARQAQETTQDASHALQARAEIAAIEAAKGDYLRAIADGREGLIQCDALNRPDLRIDFLLVIARAERKFSNLAGALATLNQALGEADQLGGRLHLSDVNLALGNLYRDLGQPEQSERHYQSALALARLQDDHPRAALALLKVGEAGLASGDWARARDMDEQARTLFSELGDQAGVADSLEARAQVESAAAQLDAAAADFVAALAIYDRMPFRGRQAELQRLLGKLEVRRGRTAEALVRFGASRDIAEAIGDHELAAEADAGLSEVHEARGEFRQAFEAERKLDADNASARDLKVRQRAAELDAGYEAERREREIQRLKDESSAAAASLGRSRRELAAVAGLAVAGWAAAAWRRRRSPSA